MDNATHLGLDVHKDTRSENSYPGIDLEVAGVRQADRIRDEPDLASSDLSSPRRTRMMREDEDHPPRDP